MIGIFKGDSIYKNGSGGGGYKDGGQLIDGDFIEVKNNTVSTYDNVSRDTVNFYFDIKDGEILNSSIEFTTQVNTTVNVYYIGAGGVLIPVGYVGSNTANAGDSYNITIMGKSFIIENVNAPSVDPDQINVYNEMDGIIYPCAKVLGKFWAGNDFNKYCNFSLVDTIKGPWRVPTYDDFLELTNNYNVEDLAAVGYWNPKVKPAPTNSTRLSFMGNGYKENLTIKQLENFGSWWQNKYFGGVNSFCMRIYQNQWNPNDCTWDFYSAAGFVNPNTTLVSLRLIFDP